MIKALVILINISILLIFLGAILWFGFLLAEKAGIYLKDRYGKENQ